MSPRLVIFCLITKMREWVVENSHNDSDNLFSFKWREEDMEDVELLVDDEYHHSENISHKFNLTLPRKVSNFCLNFRQILEQENYFALNIWKVCTATSVYSWVHLPTHAYCYKEINFLKLSIKILHFHNNFVRINYSTLGIAGKWWPLFNFQSYGL